MAGNMNDKKMRKILFFIFISVFCLQNCKKDETIGQMPIDNIAPSAVSNVKVISRPGGAKITYDVPNDEDMLYVQAIYENKNQKRTWKSSIFNNELDISGFGDVEEKKINIVSVDRSRNSSTPVEIAFKPLEPPFINVYKTIEIKEDFGGVSVLWKNTAKAELAISILSLNEKNEFVVVKKKYSSVEDGQMTVRGYEPEERKFGVYVTDRWNHQSDTLIGKYLPIYEEDLDRSLWTNPIFPGDIPITAWGARFRNLLDGVVNKNNFVHTKGGEGMPIVWTFDLGQKAKLSRFISWQRPSNPYPYNHGNPRIFELWGSNDPNPDGSWESWVKLGKFESIKPSGLALGQTTNEDIEHMSAGEEFIIPLDAPSVRYIRYVMLESWSGGDFFHISEMKMFGQPCEKNE